MGFIVMNDYGTDAPTCPVCGKPVEPGPCVEVLHTTLVMMQLGDEDIEAGSFVTDMDYSECDVYHVACLHNMRILANSIVD